MNQSGAQRHRIVAVTDEKIGSPRRHGQTGQLCQHDHGRAGTAIKVCKIKFGEDLPRTKEKISEGRAPQDLAEVLLADLRSDGSVNAYKVLETRPATIAGTKGFSTTVARAATGCTTRRCSAA